ncbi:unnamed protein product [Brachionus calyciflorus]|uniref:Mitochondrial cytochrome c oxidase subunit VIc/VIIs domain-containing protein n=1 Tax=Brachionus calyciflorus TaxID=104777 RepID=A0A813R0L0_9BILA|nr:unnamed protein product [Brachionus calyciflorus]
MSVARPAATILRRPLQQDLKKHVTIAFALSAVAAVAWKVLVADPRKKKYQEFYKTYDEERQFKRMVEAGVFDSVKPNAEKSEWIANYEKEVDQAIAALKK